MNKNKKYILAVVFLLISFSLGRTLVARAQEDDGGGDYSGDSGGDYSGVEYSVDSTSYFDPSSTVEAQYDLGTSVFEDNNTDYSNPLDSTVFNNNIENYQNDEGNVVQNTGSMPSVSQYDYTSDGGQLQNFLESQSSSNGSPVLNGSALDAAKLDNNPSYVVGSGYSMPNYANPNSLNQSTGSAQDYQNMVNGYNSSTSGSSGASSGSASARSDYPTMPSSGASSGNVSNLQTDPLYYQYANGSTASGTSSSSFNNLQTDPLYYQYANGSNSSGGSYSTGSSSLFGSVGSLFGSQAVNSVTSFLGLAPTMTNSVAINPLTGTPFNTSTGTNLSLSSPSGIYNTNGIPINYPTNSLQSLGNYSSANSSLLGSVGNFLGGAVSGVSSAYNSTAGSLGLAPTNTLSVGINPATGQPIYYSNGVPIDPSTGLPLSGATSNGTAYNPYSSVYPQGSSSPYGSSANGSILGSNYSGNNGWSVSNLTGLGLPNQSITNIITGILKFLLGSIGIVGIIGFCVSGIMYLLSFGDDDRMKTAKQAMYYSITGVIVGLVGLVAVTAINAMLNGASTF